MFRNKEKMKKPLLAALGVAGACAACCAIPLAIPLLGGLSVAGVGLVSGKILGTGQGWLLTGVGIFAILISAGIGLSRRRKQTCSAKPATQSGACAIGSDAAAQACACAAAKS